MISLRKKVGFIILTIIFSFSLSGCLYPEDRKAENQTPYEDQLSAVQKAVDEYQNSQGVLPILNRDEGTPIYQKYPIDFNRLIPRYIQEPPRNSYENGGVFQYVLVDVETNPTVKLVDLRIVEEIRNYQFQINQYKRENKYPPFEKIIDDNIFQLNHKELGFDSTPQVKSPITGNHLPFVINGQGELFVDYSQDLYQFLQEYDDEFKENEDIRDILVKHSPFVPVFSVPYTVKDGEPVFLTK